jgi:hypothetical protein
MTETRRQRIQSGFDFSLEALQEIASVRMDGTEAPGEIAEALNRCGFPDSRGHQWTAEAVMDFLASRDAQDAQTAMDRNGNIGGKASRNAGGDSDSNL